MINKEMTAFAPGRINIIGEHIDYNGGFVLPMAINRGTYAKVTFNETNLIKVVSINFDLDGVLSFDYTQELVCENIWLDYVKGVFAVLKKHGYINRYGMNIELFGNIPYGSGLSSSASLEVLIATIINEVNEFNIASEDIAILCKEVENDFIGVKSGIMDQFVIGNGKKNCVMKLDCATLEYSNSEMNLDDYSIIIANSGKKRGLVDSEYNKRRMECEEGLLIAQNTFDINNLCELSSNDLEKIKEQFNKVVYKRVKHVVSENERVIKLIDELKMKNFNEVFNILNAAHTSISKDYEVSCDELDYICEKSLENGAKAARMTGAGFGGCCIIIVESAEIKDFSNKLISDYKEKFGLNLEIYNAISEDKARVYWREI